MIAEGSVVYTDATGNVCKKVEGEGDTFLYLAILQCLLYTVNQVLLF